MKDIGLQMLRCLEEIAICVIQWVPAMLSYAVTKVLEKVQDLASIQASSACAQQLYRHQSASLRA